MVNIKQVAQEAGCSTATVSYVMNKTRRVRPETARRVMAAVSKLGYSMSFAAQNLAARHSNIMGLVVSNIANPFYSELVRSFQDHALLRNMDTLVMHTNFDPQRTLASVQRLLGLRVPGVAVMTSEMNPTVPELLLENEVCAVYFDEGRVGPRQGNLAIDYRAGIQEGLEYLLALGHRRVAFIGGLPQFPVLLSRRNAFLEVAAAHPELAALVTDAEFTLSGAYFAAAKLLAATPRPTAIMTANDTMAFGAMHYAYDQGLRVPQDLSIIGLDNISFTEYTQPALTTINQPAEEIGRLAFESLWRMLGDEEQGGRNYDVRTSLVTRQSCAPPPELA